MRRKVLIAVIMLLVVDAFLVTLTFAPSTFRFETVTPPTIPSAERRVDNHVWFICNDSRGWKDSGGLSASPVTYLADGGYLWIIARQYSTSKVMYLRVSLADDSLGWGGWQVTSGVTDIQPTAIAYAGQVWIIMRGSADKGVYYLRVSEDQGPTSGTVWLILSGVAAASVPPVLSLSETGLLTITVTATDGFYYRTNMNLATQQYSGWVRWFQATQVVTSVVTQNVLTTVTAVHVTTSYAGTLILNTATVTSTYTTTKPVTETTLVATGTGEGFTLDNTKTAILFIGILASVAISFGLGYIFRKPANAKW